VGTPTTAKVFFATTAKEPQIADVGVPTNIHEIADVGVPTNIQ